MNLASRILTPAFIVTIVRYALVAAGTWLVANGYMTEEVWQQVLGGLMAIILAFMGGADATKDKATIDGKSVDVAKLPAAVRSPLEAAVPATKGRSLLDILFGR